MKIFQNKTILSILFLLLITLTASGFYDPGLQRWINRDPVGEAGFQVLRGARNVSHGHKVASSPGRWTLGGGRNNENRHLVLRNDPVHNIDPVGLIEFEGCDGHEEELQQQFDDFCAKVNDPQFASCLGCSLAARTIVERLKNRCNNPNDSLHGIRIECEQSSSGLCSGACGWSIPGGDTIHICPQTWTSPGCPQSGCTLMHELTHMSGRGGEKWPEKVEECLGCQ
jgi:hypothetical protein